MGKINANVFASEYQLYFLDKKLLQDKLKEWIAEEDEGWRVLDAALEEWLESLGILLGT